MSGVNTKRLNEAVSRNLTRFPADFMFRLTTAEAQDLRSQFATSKSSRGGRRYVGWGPACMIAIPDSLPQCR
jgi:hypothetical protein